ncbi:hypothetical protein [Chelativorans sp. YIM 93263]|uniref:hypothetical protein n=1 Tax=Chelativorans sp. YIM 93263 TaxID=2906648 RepID=UPI0023786D4B|nr:hypothetical protein [Chelativorans sp. YIM 93263]
MDVEDRIEAEIDALLAHDDTESVIDALMSMPRSDSDPDDTWKKALHARLQERLARRMRKVLEDQPDKKTRSAA